MAGRGPASSGRRQRERDQPTLTDLPYTGEVYGEPLPKGVLPAGESWHQQTLALWDALRRSPLLANEPALGWQFLIDTALMHHTMWTKGRWEFASEVRLRVAKFGATPEDRMRLKVKVETPGQQPRLSAAPEPGKVTEINSRRARLSED